MKIVIELTDDLSAKITAKKDRLMLRHVISDALEFRSKSFYEGSKAQQILFKLSECNVRIEK